MIFEIVTHRRSLKIRLMNLKVFTLHFDSSERQILLSHLWMYEQYEVHTVQSEYYLSGLILNCDRWKTQRSSRVRTKKVRLIRWWDDVTRCTANIIFDTLYSISCYRKACEVSSLDRRHTIVEALYLLRMPEIGHIADTDFAGLELESMTNNEIDRLATQHLLIVLPWSRQNVRLRTCYQSRRHDSEDFWVIVTSFILVDLFMISKILHRKHETETTYKFVSIARECKSEDLSRIRCLRHWWTSMKWNIKKCKDVSY